MTRRVDRYEKDSVMLPYFVRDAIAEVHGWPMEERGTVDFVNGSPVAVWGYAKGVGMPECCCVEDLDLWPEAKAWLLSRRPMK